MNKKRLPLIIVIVGMSILIASIFMESEPPLPDIPQDIQGLFIDSPAVVLPRFTMTDMNGQPFNNSNFMGKWSLVFFGYTNCPDVCPTSMRILDQISRKENIDDDTQYVFISVDPKRDTTKVIKDFVGFFNAKFIGATGEKAEIDKFKDPLGVIYGYEGDTSSADYVVTHFAAIYIIDPNGRARAYVLPPHKVDQVSKSYQLIREHYGE